MGNVITRPRPAEAPPVDPGGWDRHSTRGFWTRRRKTVTSLATVFAVVASIAFAFKLFDQTIGNNVVRDAASFAFEIWKREEFVDNDFKNTADGFPIFEANEFSGDTREVDVKIRNTNLPSKDATFQVVIPLESIRVTRCADAECTTREEVPNEPGADDWDAFVRQWEFSVDRQVIVQPADGREEFDGDDHDDETVERTLDDPSVNASDHLQDNLVTPGTDDEGDDPDSTENNQYDDGVCSGGLEEFDPSVGGTVAACHLGNVKGAGTDDSLGEAQDVRYYVFHLVREGTGFEGWEVVFDLIFGAQLPARPEPNPSLL